VDPGHPGRTWHGACAGSGAGPQRQWQGVGAWWNRVLPGLGLELGLGLSLGEVGVQEPEGDGLD